MHANTCLLLTWAQGTVVQGSESASYCIAGTEPVGSHRQKKNPCGLLKCYVFFLLLALYFTQALRHVLCTVSIQSKMLFSSFQANCYQIKDQQPYPQLHQGLIPFQTKLPFSFPLSLLKSPVIRSRLKVDYSTPHLTLPHSRWDLLESPKPRGSGDQAISPSHHFKRGAQCVPRPLV